MSLPASESPSGWLSFPVGRLLSIIFTIAASATAWMNNGAPAPSLFIGLSTGALIFGILLLAMGVRNLFPQERTLSATVGADRRALLDKKDALLHSLRELELDNDMGKLEAADFKRLRHQLRSEAKRVMQKLDQDLGPYLEEARARILFEEANVENVEEETPVCESCGTENESDAVFCKKCAHRLKADDAKEGEEE